MSFIIPKNTECNNMYQNYVKQLLVTFATTLENQLRGDSTD